MLLQPDKQQLTWAATIQHPKLFKCLKELAVESIFLDFKCRQEKIRHLLGIILFEEMATGVGRSPQSNILG
jgi:hypothetical protein